MPSHERSALGLACVLLIAVPAQAMKGVAGLVHVNNKSAQTQSKTTEEHRFHSPFSKANAIKAGSKVKGGMSNLVKIAKEQQREIGPVVRARLETFYRFVKEHKLAVGTAAAGIAALMILGDVHTAAAANDLTSVANGAVNVTANAINGTGHYLAGAVNGTGHEAVNAVRNFDPAQAANATANVLNSGVDAAHSSVNFMGDVVHSFNHWALGQK